MRQKNKFLLLLASFLIMTLIFGMSAFADNENGTRINPGADLTYWLHVKYDGIDKEGVNSKSSKTIAEVFSDKIEVNDRLPEGLTFVDFSHISSGVFGAAVQNSYSGTSCEGYVVDDSNSSDYSTGIWDSTNTEYNYHGLHYNKNTREITFTVERLSAGCQIDIAIETKVPNTVDDPDTTNVETRRDFYNSASIIENDITNKSETLHHFILEDLLDPEDPDQNGENDLKEVSYVLDSSCSDYSVDIETKKYVVGTTVGVEANLPDKQTIKFDGWSTTDATIENHTFVMPNKNVTFTGACSLIPQASKYKVTYEIEGEGPQGFVLPGEKQYEESEIVTRDSLEKGFILDGYKFLGWQSSDVTVDANNQFAMPDADVTFVGKWELITYTITYEFTGDLPSNHAELLPSSIKVAPGTTVTLPKIEHQGLYAFLGWNKEDFNMPEEDVTITGEWMQFPGTYLPEILVEVVDEQNTYRVGDTIRFRVTVTNKEDFPIQNVRVWEINPSVYFPESTRYIKTSDKEIEIPEVGAKSSFSFEYDYTVKEEDSIMVENIVYLISANNNRNYVFENTNSWIKSYCYALVHERVTVSFDSNGGTGDMQSTKIYKGDKYTLPENEFKAPSNKTFGGWDKGEVGKEIIINENTVIKAKWKDITFFTNFTVSFDLNGHGDSIESQKVRNNKTATRPKDPKTEGYIFDDWYIDKNCTSKFDFTTPITSDMKLYAKWLSDKNNNDIADINEEFYITFDPNGGSWNGSTNPIVIKYKYGELITIADAPEKDGFVFDYWEGSRHYPGDQYEVVENHSFKAIWKIHSQSSREDNYKIPLTGVSDALSLGMIIISSLATLVLAVYILFNKKQKIKLFSILLLVSSLWLSTYSLGLTVNALDYTAPIKEVSKEIAYDENHSETFAVTKEAHWTKQNEAELNITIDAEEVYLGDYDDVLIGVDVTSGNYDIDKTINNNEANNDYQKAVKYILEKLTDKGFDYSDSIFTYNGLETEETNKNSISLDLREADGTTVQTKNTHMSYGMDLFYAMHTYKNGPLTYAGLNPNYIKSEDNILVILLDSGESYISDEYDYKEFYSVPCSSGYESGAGNWGDTVTAENPEGAGGGPWPILKEFIDKSKVSRLIGRNKPFADGDCVGSTTKTSTHLQDTKALIKQYFPNATIVSVRYANKDNGRNYAKHFSDDKFTTLENSVAQFISYKDIANLYINGLRDSMTFNLTDTISEYFTISSVKDITCEYGSVSLVKEDGKDKIIWNHPDKLPTGMSRSIKIKLRLKDDFKDADTYLPTNTILNTSHKLNTSTDTIDNSMNETPVLASKYSVTYETNAPEGCSLPTIDSERHSVYEIVKIREDELSCEGYTFKGYQTKQDVEMITDNSFIMPENDVTISAVWGKSSISKSQDGSTKVYTRPTAAQYIKNLHDLAQKPDLADEDPDKGVRYIGANPNNYVTFNNETWRIIGVFDVDDGSGNIESRVKIIRDASLGNFSYCSTDATITNSGYGQNNWPNAFLNWELNSNPSGNTDDWGTPFTGYLDYVNISGTDWWYNGTGLNQWGEHNRSNNLRKESQDMIGNAKWYLLSPNYTSEDASILNSLNAGAIYDRERNSGSSGKACAYGDYCNDSWGSASSWNGLVGLIYPSDYKYAQDANGNWLYMTGEQHTISPSAHSSWATSVISINNGSFKWANASDASATRPCVYLRADVCIVNGNGTSTNQYILSLPE